MIVIVHGYEGSGAGHWQRWLEEELRRRGRPVVFPDLPDPVTPQKDAWVAVLDAVVATSTTPIVFACHSLGCWAVDHLLAERGSRGIRAALLVAPPSPFVLFEPIESFLPPPQRREAWAALATRTLLVGSDDDDYTSAEEFAEIAGTLGVRSQIIPGAGHINAAAGYGPWPFALEWLESVEAP